MKDELSYGEILLHVDYSENYKNAQQDEIQSAYFGHTCFSLFTACCYYKSDSALKNISTTITSESSDHSRIAAFSCVNAVIKHAQEQIKPVQIHKVIVWSDGCAAQFRSKFVFMLMTYFDSNIDLEWNYNE